MMIINRECLPRLRRGRHSLNEKRTLEVSSGQQRGRHSISKNLFQIILILCSMSACSVYASDDNDPQVVIQVLSKQVRLMREGLLEQFSMILQKDSIIADELNSSSLHGNTILFKNDRGRIDVYIDSRPVSAPFHLEIYSSTNDGICTVKLAAEERIYSLPFSVQCDSGGLRFYARERLKRYAVDSALAEYGTEFWKEKEAILALAQVIVARYFYMKNAARHKVSDFCDLTHCQVYRGRMNSAIRFNDAWMIDHEKLRHNLFFHSRCGGSTADLCAFGETGKSPGTQKLGVRDWLYREGVRLCASADCRWERSISHDELVGIFSADLKKSDSAEMRLNYNKNTFLVQIQTGAGTAEYPVETFRLKINRIKGWNFIRSNNMSISETTVNGKRQYIFQGEGLGHCVGLCQHGAVNLSRMGYTRYEILEHYFPDLAWKSKSDTADYSPYLSYCIFDMPSGSVLAMSHGPGFLRRKVPPGSVFKLIVSLYLAEERPDLFNTYMYECPGKNTRDRCMPDRCWKPKGHGAVGIQDAIANSCNLYFASLYNRIDGKKFRKFFDRLCRRLDMTAALPEITDESQWSNLLAGLDFKISFTIADYMRLVRFLYCSETMEREGTACRTAIPQPERYKILMALQNTFVRGTASGRLKPSGDPCNYRVLAEWLNRSSSEQQPEIWGKTSTIINGTNKPLSYGLFIGGSGATGIVVVLRKANGHVAAKWAEMVLSRFFVK